jgi:hypothetical protein
VWFGLSSSLLGMNGCDALRVGSRQAKQQVKESVGCRAAAAANTNRLVEEGARDEVIARRRKTRTRPGMV